METFNGRQVLNVTEIKDANIDLLVVVASLRERLRINSDLMASSKTVKLPEGLARLSVARSGVVDFEYDVLQAHPRGELSIGSVDQEDN